MCPASQQFVSECEGFVALFWKCTATKAVCSVQDGETETTSALVARHGGKHVVAQFRSTLWCLAVN